MQEIQKMQLQSLGQEEPLQAEMATHSSIFAWRIPSTEEPDGLQSMESQSWTWLSTHMAGSRDYHTEWSKTEKDKYHMTSFICGILVFRQWYIWTYLQNSNRLINIKNKLMAPTGLEVWSSHVVRSLWLLEVKNCPQENWAFILVTARNWVLSMIMWA